MTENETHREGLDFASLSEESTAPIAAMYQALVEEIPAILYINGPEEDSPTLYVSPQTIEILGLAPEGWYDNTWTTHVHPDDRGAVEANYVNVLRQGALQADEYRFVRPDGEVIWLHDTIRVIRDGDGKPALVQGVMFDITARKRTEELLTRQTAGLERIAAVSQRFTELLLAGGDLQSILDTLADIVSKPVVFDDAARQLVGFAAVSGVDDGAVLESWDAHSRIAHDNGSNDDCAWAPVRLRDEEWGRLHILTKDDTADEIDNLAIDRAAAAIGLWLLSGQDRTGLADRARSELIADLWQGRRWSGSDARARSRSLGGDLDRPVLMAVAVDFDWGGYRDPSEHDEPGTRRLLYAVRGHLQRLTAEGELTCMVAIVGSVCLAIIGLSADDQGRVVTARIAHEVRAALQDDLRGRVMSVGVSRPGSAETLRRILTEATDAAAHGAHSLRLSGTYYSADLGLRHLLARLSDGPELGLFVEDELGPLLTHDATGKLPLLPTLRAYLESGGQKATAARVLHLERRSLYYRLERIEALLEADLDDPSARLRAEVALQGLDVLRQRHSGYAAPSV